MNIIKRIPYTTQNIAGILIIAFILAGGIFTPAQVHAEEQIEAENSASDVDLKNIWTEFTTNESEFMEIASGLEDPGMLSDEERTAYVEKLDAILEILWKQLTTLVPPEECC